MKPVIGKVVFGSIEIEGEKIHHDVLIRLNGQVERRKKELSKELYGTSHILSLAEAKASYEDGAQLLLMGSGHFGRCELSEEATTFFGEKGCAVRLLRTPRAAREWNRGGERVIGLFHITC